MRKIPPYDYKPVPGIYQIEATNACHLDCPRCPRKEAAAARGGIQFLQREQLQGWIRRGDLAGTWYLELQMSGEPLVHPHIGDLVRILQDEAGVWVGMATNGQLLQKKAAEVSRLDAITVSIDTADPAEYGAMRPGATFEAIERGIAELLAQPARPRYLNIFTIAGYDEPEAAVRERKRQLRERFPEFTVTSAIDCFVPRHAQGSCTVLPEEQEVCINPWTSVSVQADGTVVSCCYAWDHREPNRYGNLNEERLADIWAGPNVRAMRTMMRGPRQRGYCATCYARSPFLLHLDGLARATRRR